MDVFKGFIQKSSPLSWPHSISVPMVKAMYSQIIMVQLS